MSRKLNRKQRRKKLQWSPARRAAVARGPRMTIEAAYCKVIFGKTVDDMLREEMEACERGDPRTYLTLGPDGTMTTEVR